MLGERQGFGAGLTALLTDDLDYLGQGMAAIDTELRPVTANRPFHTLPELVRELGRRGTTAEAIYCLLAERGDFGGGDCRGGVRDTGSAAGSYR